MTDEDFNAVFNLPFNQATEFFKDKLNIPSRKWDDLWKEEHAKGFMSAGAMKAELLNDLRSEVEKGIAGNITPQQFLKSFDDIVARHGWNYYGTRRWRSDLIYDTNVTTAYQAGRWSQFHAGGAKFLKYVHADGVRRPRPQHVAWNGLVLPITHIFWDSHYPPNGWRCHCRAVVADASEVTKEPEGWKNIDPKTGTMKGIDSGWDYNVGKAGAEKGYDALTRKFESLPVGIAREWMQSFLASPTFQRFYDQKIDVNFPVAVLDPKDKVILGANTQTVWFSPVSLSEHLEKHPDITIEDYRKIQQILENGEVYQQENNRLVYLNLDGKLYRAAVKTTKDKAENFFLTLFETTEERLKNQQIREIKRIR